MSKESLTMNAPSARVTAAVITLVFVLLSASESRASALYSVTDLGSTSAVTITGLNDAGQVVGTVYPAFGTGKSYAFVYDGTPAGTVTPLGGSLDPTNYPAVRDSFPQAINNSGQILATDQTGSVTGTPGSSFVYSNGQTTILPVSASAFNDQGQVVGQVLYMIPCAGSRASALNDQGQVVGAYLYDLATKTIQYMTATGTAATQIAQAVNNSGQATGSLTNGHPFLYSNGKTIDLGTLGGTSGYGSAINSQGDVVGTAQTASSQSHAFLYSNGAMKDLGVLPGDLSSAAVSINNLGQVVGTSSSGDFLYRTAFLYRNGVMKNLNDLIGANSGWKITDALKINNRGQILALGQNSQGVDFLLLTPDGIPTPGNAVYPTIVPEPSTWMLFGVLVGGLVVRQRCGHRIPVASRCL
jgi:probable HAF family extracellular repeat protein